MKLTWTLAAAIVAPLALTTYAADDVDIQALKQEIQELDQKVRVLERQRENDQDDQAAVLKTAPKISIGANGFSFGSADSNFVATIHGVIQVDSRTFVNERGLNGNDGFLLRRARPILTGTVFHNFDFNFTPDFGGNAVQIFDAYVNYHYNPDFQIQAGKFKSPVTLEALQSDNNLSFNERSLATDLAPNRDLGVALHGDVIKSTVNYWAGIFDGAPDYNGTTTNSSYDNDKAFVGRVFAQPWKNSDLAALQGLGFGLGGSYEVDRASTTTIGNGLTPGYTTDGQQKFFSYSSGTYAYGTHWRLSPQAYYYYGPFGVLAEYIISDQNVKKTTAAADLHNTAWEVSGGWVLTGEDAGYNGITPKHPFDFLKNQWGAWQVVARFEQLDVDKKAFPVFASSASSAQQAQAWSVGLNWYLNRDIRAGASFSHTLFNGYTGASPAVAAQPENAIFTRIQLAF